MLVRSSKLLKLFTRPILARPFSIYSFNILQSQTSEPEQTHLKTVRLSGEDEAKKTEIESMDL